MSKISYVFIAGLTAVIGANAGVIQIGAGVNGVNGLTSAYITGNGGSLGGWAEKSYTTTLFQSATLTPTGANTLPTGAAAATMTDQSGNKFSMINEGTTGLNEWASPAGGTVGSIIIPINVAAASDVYLMLNDYAGFAGANPSITFNFSSGSFTDAIPDLANGLGAIRSAVNCTSVTVAGSITCPNPQTVPAGNTVSSDSGTTNVNTLLSGDKITTQTVWTGTYSISANATFSDYFYNSTQGSSGNVMLDELHFQFAASRGILGTLNSITITPSGAAGGGTSRLALTAIDVVQTVPEPSTVMMFLSGFGILGLGRLRNRKQ